MPLKIIVSPDAKLQKHPAKVQAALITTISQASDVLYKAVLDEAPVLSGALKSAMSLGTVSPYGPHRVRVSVVVDLDKAPYYHAVIKGVEPQTVGQEGKIYSDASRGGDMVFTGQWQMPERLANNFPRRALRKSLRQITGLTKKHFIIGVTQ